MSFGTFWTRSIVTVFSLMTFVGCGVRGCSSEIKDISPEDQLHAYIVGSVNVTRADQREELVDLTTGPMKSALVNASEETFKRAYIDKKFDFKSFELLQRKDNTEKKEVYLDFKLVYKSWSAGETKERAPEQENTNRATMVYDNGRWALSRVENLGSSFEWAVGLPMDSVSTNGVTPEDAPKEVQSSRELNEELQKQSEAPQQ